MIHLDLKTVADQYYLILVYLTLTPDGFINYKATTCTDDQIRRFQRLQDHGYIESAGNGYYRLTRRGVSAAKEAQELREQAAERTEEEGKKRFFETQRELTIALASAVAGGLLTLIVELLVFLMTGQ